MLVWRVLGRERLAGDLVQLIVGRVDVKRRGCFLDR
jgi:hypothetical protein